MWDQVADYVMYAERWQWTPEQVDRLPVWLDSRMHHVAEIFDELRDDARRRAEEQAEREAARRR
ncbi:hypothetical protein ACFU6S_18815 [Streptomyces sp. NPDC057456]|uniref:hypothetical protein n=1 Tax=Streptomyces sp. NPDC057456 TaxID=3346139 RepID=UPI0036BBBFD0